MQQELILGVDGGKTKTVCVLADTERGVIGRGYAGSSDKYDVPLEQALDAVEEAVRNAAHEASVSLPVAVGCFGLAGADWPEDFEQLEQGLRARGLAERVIVKNDMHVALHANVEHGVLLSAGTHTAAAIRTPDGHEWFSGWFSVNGPGGVTAGHRALWAVLHARDGRGAPTALTAPVLEATNTATAEELLRKLSQGDLDDADFAALAPLLFEAHYEAGDQVAAEIIIDLGKEMARWVTGLLTRFDLLAEAVPVILTGGLFRGKGPLLEDTVRMIAHVRAPRADLRRADREPVMGAVMYAYEALGRGDLPGWFATSKEPLAGSAPSA